MGQDAESRCLGFWVITYNDRFRSIADVEPDGLPQKSYPVSKCLKGSSS